MVLHRHTGKRTWQSARRLAGCRGGATTFGLVVLALAGLATGTLGLVHKARDRDWRIAALVLARDIDESAAAIGRAGPEPDMNELSRQSMRLDSAAQQLGSMTPGIADHSERIEAVIQGAAQLKATSMRALGFRETADAVAAARRTSEQATTQLIDLYQEVLNRLAQAGASRERIIVAGAQIVRSARIRILGQRLLASGHDAGQTAARMIEEIHNFSAAHAQLEGQGPIGVYLQEHGSPLASMNRAAESLVQAGPAIAQLQAAMDALPASAAGVREAVRRLHAALDEDAGPGGILPEGWPHVAMALGFAALALALGLLVRDARRGARETRGGATRRNEAIQGLLDELGALADGDLTIRADVAGDFTGAIAEALNATVDTLRGLVGTINETATDISGAIGNSQANAAALKDASDHQITEVSRIAGSMQKSADALNEVAVRAEQLSQRAATSVADASAGAATVGRTIQGMTALRGQIQDTAKRIKRLANSSQEVGTIIQFIDELSEQTNTLALNASIQAAMAGESGRGFAPLADEVQRLAERASAATQQIETLIRAIQADTNAAIVSMERSTTQVVAGARSAEEAGQALSRIESTSNDLARMIQDISGEARAEAAHSTRLATQIESTRDTAIHTAASAQTTAEALEALRNLALRLRNSVANFRLASGRSPNSGRTGG
ncbi:MAG: methyl-accepting chemotaxis protein [Panacagrimonas sp.]